MDIEELDTQLEALLAETEERDGYTGEVLGMIQSIIKIDGELYTDYDCLQLIRDLSMRWHEVIND